MKNKMALTADRNGGRGFGALRAMADLENEMERWLGSSLGWMGVSEPSVGFDFIPSCSFVDS